jgi:hypothetical protein
MSYLLKDSVQFAADRLWHLFGLRDSSGQIYPSDWNSGPVLAEAVRDTRKKLNIVADHLLPSFYAGHLFLDALRHSVESSPDLEIGIIATFGAQSRDSAVESLQRDHAGLLEILQGCRLHRVYWAEAQPKYHFAVADNFVLREEKHQPGQPRRVQINHYSPAKAREYLFHFESMTLCPLAHPLDI